MYTDHGYPTTVARFSPNGEWVASADASGTVRIWGRYNDHVLKNEFRVLTGRVDDLMWSADGLRIVASGDCKGKAFVRAFMWVILRFASFSCSCVSSGGIRILNDEYFVDYLELVKSILVFKDEMRFKLHKFTNFSCLD